MAAPRLRQNDHTVFSSSVSAGGERISVYLMADREGQQTSALGGHSGCQPKSTAFIPFCNDPGIIFLCNGVNGHLNGAYASFSFGRTSSEETELNCDSASREGGFEEADPSHKAKGLFG